MSQVALFDIEASNPQIPTSFDTNAGTAIPIANNLEILGATVANGTFAEPTWTTGSGKTVTVNVQIGTAIAGTPADSNDAGLVSFDNTQFTVDANGFVRLAGGGLAIDSIAVDANTAPGTNPVAPDAAGQLTISGSSVAAHSVPVETHSRAVNSFEVEIQYASQQAASSAVNAGLSSYNSSHFSVDANGFVSLAGGGLAIDSFTTDVAGPVAPDAAGAVDVTGTSIFSDGTAANTLTLNVQATANTFLLGAGASSTATELGPLTNGQLFIGNTGNPPTLGSLASSDGSITITPGAGTIDLAIAAGNDAILTVTGDSGGALSPTAGNINVLGLSGSKTSGSGSTLTISSPPFSDKGASATSLLNEGEFVTGAFTRTTPLSAGLADGDLQIYVATSASAIVVQLQAGQIAHIGSTATSAGGTLTSTAIGSAICMRYQASSDDFWAISVLGNWILA